MALHETVEDARLLLDEFRTERIKAEAFLQTRDRHRQIVGMIFNAMYAIIGALLLVAAENMLTLIPAAFVVVVSTFKAHRLMGKVE